MYDGHECPFEAYITNLGKYNEGELVGEWVEFPATNEKLRQVFERIGIDGKRYEEWFITDYDCHVAGLCDSLGEYESLDELNYLANTIAEMGRHDFEEFKAAMICGQYTGSAKDLINLTQNLDCYDIYSGVDDHKDVGYYYVHDAGIYDLESMGPLANYIDYEAFGRDIAMDESGHFTEYGYVVSDRDTFTEHYDGKVENIPEEYMVTPKIQNQETIRNQIDRSKEIDEEFER